MCKRLEQILSQLPAENNTNKNVAILLKKMMEGMAEIAEQEGSKSESTMAPMDVITCVTLAGAALISDMAASSKEEDAVYVMVTEYAKSAIDSAFFMINADLFSVIDRLN